MYVSGLIAKIRDFWIIGKIKSKERYVGRRIFLADMSTIFYSKEAPMKDDIFCPGKDFCQNPAN